MKFPIGYPLSFSFQHHDVQFTVQGEPAGNLCITCEHTVFVQRFSGHTKCFYPFISSPFLPDETDINYDYFLTMKDVIVKAHSQLAANEA